MLNILTRVLNDPIVLDRNAQCNLYVVNQNLLYFNHALSANFALELLGCKILEERGLQWQQVTIRRTADELAEEGVIISIYIRYAYKDIFKEVAYRQVWIGVISLRQASFIQRFFVIIWRFACALPIIRHVENI